MALAQALYGEANGGGMVGEVVDDLDPTDLALELLAPGDTVKRLQAGADFTGSEASEGSCGCGHGSVPDVKLTGHRQPVANSTKRERAAVWIVARVLDPQGAVFPEADAGEWAGRVLGDVEAVLLVAVDEGVTTARDNVEQAAEGELNFVQIVINVRMVEFDIVDHNALGQIMKELRALIEKGGVIFIAFQHIDPRVGEMRATIEIFRQSADHVAGISTGVFKNPCQHRRRGRLSMGARDHEIPFAPEEEFLHHLGQRIVKQLPVQSRLGLRISPRNGVTDDDHIRVCGDVFRCVSLRESDALAPEEVRHRWIDIRIRAGNGEAALFHSSGDSAHGGATDASEVEIGFVRHRKAGG